MAAVIFEEPKPPVSRLDPLTGVIYLAPGDMVTASNGLSVLNGSTEWQTFSPLRIGQCGVCFRFSKMTDEEAAEFKLMSSAISPWGGKDP